MFFRMRRQHDWELRSCLERAVSRASKSDGVDHGGVGHEAAIGGRGGGDGGRGADLAFWSSYFGNETSNGVRSDTFWSKECFADTLERHVNVDPSQPIGMCSLFSLFLVLLPILPHTPCAASYSVKLPPKKNLFFSNAILS